MKKHPKRKHVGPPPLTASEAQREQAKIALKRAVKRERTIRALAVQLERGIAKRNGELRALARFLAIQLMDRTANEALDRSEESSAR